MLAARAVATRRGPSADSAYRPLDTPKPVADGVWTVDSGPLKPAGVPVPLRMTVLKLANGDLVLHSPTRYSARLARELEPIGRVAHLVAPNSAHWMFVRDWQAAYPDATTWAVPGLRDRGQVKRSGVRLDHDLGDDAPDAWAGEVRQGIVPGGLGFREAWLFHEASGTLVLTDLVQNIERERMPPVAKLLMRLADGDDGRPARHLRAVLRLGGRGTKDALRRLLDLDPVRVIFSHGRPFEERAAERLRRAFKPLL
ncbi:hypothetical protein CKY28_08125 [Sphingomonas lenta]|uniref:DUF4336 domain-containing protein n=1 Tax=Sphingomonas lenta TaxID=1141887 RepID=A0A2A2SGH7_9SPHN|nr:hypothetical protein CKY28_08125 [Sphingomonas lenta]